MESEAAAAWVQAVGSVAAIFATAYFIHYEKKLDRQEREQENRVRALGVAAELDMVLAPMSARLAFEPIDDTGAMTTDEAHSAMRLHDGDLDALRTAAQEAYLFGSPTADEIILLALEASRYQAILANWAGKMDHDAQTFLERIRDSTPPLQSRVDRVRALLKNFLPREAKATPEPDFGDGEP